jgi:hypothetical protein
MNFEDQVKYIDLAATMSFEYILIDAWWDTRLGYEKMKELIRYARSKGVGVFLWYNSNGSFNNAFKSPMNKMNTSIVRKQEMKLLQEAGVKGLKVDFLGGDKQETMRLYENILSDANDYGLMVIFHGATLPRGWERMFPNFVGSEAVPASELDFMQNIPTTWDEKLFIDGYPGKYCVVAQYLGQKWYVAGVKAEKFAMDLKLNLPILAGQKVAMYNDNRNKETYMDYVKVSDNGDVSITIQSNGGFVLTK